VRLRADRLLTSIDLAATALFAVEGARRGVLAGLDVFGVIVVASATALGGGILRDLLIGDIPPASLRSVAYPVAALGAGAAVLGLFLTVGSVPTGMAMGVLDAAGLALFAVTGAVKALDHRMNALLAVLLGTMTGVGGGTIRDVLLDIVPGVLRQEVYAVAAALGAATVVLAARFGARRSTAMVAGAVACFALRVAALHWDWDLPRVRPR
jgi:uncharacterized membrane protein YeiH